MLNTRFCVGSLAYHHEKPEYAAMGIPDALLPIIKNDLNKVVQSSPGIGDTLSVRRSPEATKYWDRILKASGATYDQLNDIYTLL